METSSLQRKAICKFVFGGGSCCSSRSSCCIRQRRRPGEARIVSIAPPTSLSTLSLTSIIPLEVDHTPCSFEFSSLLWTTWTTLRSSGHQGGSVNLQLFERPIPVSYVFISKPSTLRTGPALTGSNLTELVQRP